MKKFLKKKVFTKARKCNQTLTFFHRTKRKNFNLYSKQFILYGKTEKKRLTIFRENRLKSFLGEFFCLFVFAVFRVKLLFASQIESLLTILKNHVEQKIRHRKCEFHFMYIFVAQKQIKLSKAITVTYLFVQNWDVFEIILLSWGLLKTNGFFPLNCSIWFYWWKKNYWIAI